jgi:type VI secretion system secreted protein Hcp
MKKFAVISLFTLLMLLLMISGAGCQELPAPSPEATTPSASPEISTTPAISTSPPEASQPALIPPVSPPEETTPGQEPVPPAPSPETTSEPEPAPPAADPEPETEIPAPPTHSSAYIKFDGIDGESQSADHRGWSEIVAFSQAITSPSSGSTGATRRRGDINFEDIIVVKQVDKASPKIAEALCQGKAFARVEIHLTGPSAGSTCVGTFYVCELKNVVITSYKVTGSNPLAYALVAPAPDTILPYSGPFIVQAVDAPMEEFTLNFEEIKVTYTECDSTGKKKGNVEYSWKIEETLS